MKAIKKDLWEDSTLLYVNYQDHKDVCAKSIERLEKLQEVKAMLIKRVDPAKILEVMNK